MKKVKITVLRKMFNEDLVKEYGADGLTACPMLKEGQVFYADYARLDFVWLSSNWKQRMKQL